MGLANCYFSMILILLPTGNTSRFEDLQIHGTCGSQEMSFLIVSHHRLKITTKWMIFFVPLPQREDTVRLSYQMQNEYAYLGDCAYGLVPYVYKDSVCQRVMTRFGPRGTY